MATKQGIVKKTSMAEYKNIRKSGINAISLRDDDELIEVKVTNLEKEIFLVTKKGMCIRFKETDVRPTGRTSMGVIGMSIAEDDEVIGMELDSQGDYLLFVSEKGMGKCTKIDAFNSQYRAGKGVRCYRVTDKTGNVVGVKAVHLDDEVMIITNEGILIRIMVEDISIQGRVTSGVKLINIESDSDIMVASLAKVKDDKTKESEDDIIKNLEKELEEE